MSEQSPFTIDGTPPPRPRLSRSWTVAAAAVAVLSLGGGAVAYAASQNPSGAGSTVAYGYSSSVSGAPARPGGPLGDHDGDGPMGHPAGPHTPHLAGTVKSTSAGKILITDFDGFTRTINVSSATKYSGGLTATPKVGTVLHAEGKVDADGTSLDATAVGTMPAGGPDHGPGMHHRGPRPSGTSATPKPSVTTPAPSATSS